MKLSDVREGAGSLQAVRESLTRVRASTVTLGNTKVNRHLRLATNHIDYAIAELHRMIEDHFEGAAAVPATEEQPLF